MSTSWVLYTLLFINFGFATASKSEIHDIIYRINFTITVEFNGGNITNITQIHNQFMNDGKSDKISKLIKSDILHNISVDHPIHSNLSVLSVQTNNYLALSSSDTITFNTTVAMNKSLVNSTLIYMNSKQGLATDFMSSLNHYISLSCSQCANTNNVQISPLTMSWQEDTDQSFEHYVLDETFREFLIIIVVLFACVLVLGFLDARWLRINDFYNIGGLLMCFLRMLATMSHFFFSIHVWNEYQKNTSHTTLLIIFIISICCIFIPIVVSICQLYYAVHHDWVHRDEIRAYLREFSKIMYTISVLTGSSFAAIRLCNSHLLGLALFQMGLRKAEIQKFQIQRIYSMIFLEDLPQLVLMAIFVSMFGSFSSITYTSMTVSSLSIVVSIMACVTSKKLLWTQKAVLLKFEVTSQEIVDNLKKCRSQISQIQRKIAGALGLDYKIVYIPRPTLIPGGLLVEIYVFVNDMEDIDFEELLTEEKIADILRESWQLDGRPSVANMICHYKQALDVEYEHAIRLQSIESDGTDLTQPLSKAYPSDTPNITVFDE